MHPSKISPSTSRNKQGAYYLVGNYDRLVHVGRMDDAEVFDHLKTKLSVDSTAKPEVMGL